MSAEVSVVCPVCGEVKVVPAGVALLLYPDDTGYYTFRCPECREMITRSVTAGGVRLLRSVHVQEARIRPHSSPAAPITEDDLIAFGQSIERGEDPWGELDAMTSSRRS